MAELILHHYDQSPYAEKIRLVFGLKGLPWRSVKIPVIMPKPDLMPLTGGYRRTPVLQMGADIYCDTELIAVELERRHPTPTLFPEGGHGLAAMIGNWVASTLFMPSVRYPFGANADQMPAEFLKDRAAMRGQAPDPEVMRAGIKAATGKMHNRLRAQLAWIESLLADGRAYLLGSKPGLADCSVFHCVWYVRNAATSIGGPLRIEQATQERAPAPPKSAQSVASLAPYPRVVAWMDRMDRIGHGKPTPMTGAEALDVAKEAKPETAVSGDPADAEGLKPGDRVAVVSEDTGRDPVTGELVRIAPNEIALRREDPRVGEVAVHFPRVGYDIKRA
jgi:glutathione S-transferase